MWPLFSRHGVVVVSSSSSEFKAKHSIQLLDSAKQMTEHSQHRWQWNYYVGCVASVVRSEASLHLLGVSRPSQANCPCRLTHCHTTADQVVQLMQTDSTTHAAITYYFCRGYHHQQECGIGVPGSAGFGPESSGFGTETKPSFWGRLHLRLHTPWKFCLYTIVHLLLEEFRFSLKSSLSTQSVCHTLRPGVGVWFWHKSQSREC